ncbi:MAG: hypothetical protein ACXW2G_00620 [Burkholderiaceae bacterium]
MNRSQLVKQLAEIATKPIGVAIEPAAAPSGAVQVSESARTSEGSELFVWFEDTSARAAEGGRGMAGLPESLLPYGSAMRILDRRYAEDHFHLLSAVRIRCRDEASELIAALYTAALSVGTVAWIGTGSQYCRTWNDMYPSSTERAS